MILVDTSVWIDHLRKPEPELQKLLLHHQIVTHPFVRLELALGSIESRAVFLAELAKLPHAPTADFEDLFRLVEARKLERKGIGITDLHLLASALLDQSLSIWTRDRRLGDVADQIGLRAPIS